MTPTQHKTEAERLLDLTSDTRRLVTDQDHMVITAHALLAKAAGTGTHYATADTALTKAAQYREQLHNQNSYATSAQLALSHAYLAD